MKCKSLLINLGQLIVCTVAIIAISGYFAKAQFSRAVYNDVATQRLLIRITAQYIHTISQGQIDMDSAIRIPCNVYQLSPLLAYNEGYSDEDGKHSAGTRLLDAGKVAEASALLSKQHQEARLRLLLDLGSYFVFKPGTEKADLDQASTYINEALRLSRKAPFQWQVESKALRAHWLDQSGFAAEGQKVFDELVALCNHTGNALASARLLLRAGELLHYGDPDRLIKFEKALSIFRKANAKEKEIETLSLINIEYFVAKKYDVAENYLRTIVNLQHQINFRHQQYPYDALSWLAYRKGALTDALAYSNKSLASLASKADSTFISYFYTRRGLIYERLHKLNESLTWYDKGLENRTPGTRLFWYRAVIGKVITLNEIGRAKEALALLKKVKRNYPPNSYFDKMHFAFLLGKTYANLKKISLAESNYQVFLTMAEKFPVEYIHDEFPAAFFQISTFYRTIGKTRQARDYLELGKDYTSSFDIVAKDNYYYNLFKIDSMEGRHLDAIRHLKHSYEFTDSVFSYDQRKRTEELLVKYEAEKKDKNIQLLNSQNQLERIRTEQAHRTRNIMLAGLVLLLIIIALLFNRYIIKQRANQKLVANQRELDQKNSFLETLTTEQDKLLKEKEWLLKEVHHRVKNNLQMVTSLLYSQSVYLQDETAKLAVKDSLRRMQAMALIHQKLYQDENTSSITMPEYINDLISYLQESFDEGGQITFKQTIEPLSLDVSQAIPLGLIITESIVNTMKHAFLGGQKGVVRIELLQDGPDFLVLKIADNGIGLPTGLDTKEYNSLGLELMQGLAKQLNGFFTIESSNGVLVTVRFISLSRHYLPTNLPENMS
ncbi:histidine kinase dimerization/phosphoacceptor domain -containing protein [Spirosoma aerolatum]|uniref:histidine kinase dimerization/phosphoacceptor domain -containing protein n=1 Tax=Spirosoma aerolatum TaxID=1211326 RepID=UPI0009AD9274|nr:histidine kinase dimerization/phosphoacceptor domain -containing protein [Spirosoma aerolatum]